MKKLSIVLLALGVLASVTVDAQFGGSSRVWKRVYKRTPPAGGGGGGGGGSLITSSDFTWKGGMRIQQMGAYIGTSNNSTSMMVRCLNGSNTPVACSSATTSTFEIFWLGAQTENADGVERLMTVVSGGTSTSATVSMTVGASPPANNTWLWTSYGCCGTQRYPVQITSSVANGGNFDITWTPATPDGAVSNGSRLATEYQVLMSCRYVGTGSLSTSSTVSMWPTCSGLTKWGDHTLGKRKYLNGASNMNGSAAFTEGLFFIEDGTNDFFAVYKPNYAGQVYQQSLIRCHLDDGTHTVSSCGGPWVINTPGTNKLWNSDIGVPTNFLSGSIMSMPTTWTSTNLSKTTCYGFGDEPTSGTPQPYGTQVFALCDSQIPTIATASNTTASPLTITKTLLAFDFNNRMPRDTGYTAHYGSVPWAGVASAVTATSMTFTESSPSMLDTGTDTYPGLTFPTKIVWGAAGDCSDALGTGNVTGHTSTTISYTKTSGANLANGNFVCDFTNSGSGIFNLNAVKRTITALEDWVDNNTTGTGTPTHGYFGPAYDAQSRCWWVDTTNRQGVLCGGYWASGARWYGTYYQSGTGEYGSTCGSQGNCAQAHKAMLAIWNPADLAAVAAGDNPWTKTPTTQLDLATKGMIVANETANYPTNTSPSISVGSVWTHEDPSDTTKTLVLMIVPGIDSFGVAGYTPAIQAFWIPK